MDDSFVEETDGFGDQFFGHKKKTCFRESHFGGIKLDANMWFNKALLRDNGGS